jgi:aspartate aminotransferase
MAYFERQGIRMKPTLSEHFQNREPSDIRLAQIEFMKRGEPVEAVNVAIGNVSLPMHPAMIRRMAGLAAEGSPFRDGVVKYTPTVGLEETRRAFLNVIASSGFPTQGLHAQITDGGSQAMELIVLGVCGPAGSGKRPLLVIDPTYTNYMSMAERTGRATASMSRALGPDGRFTLPGAGEIERLIRRHQPGGLLVIPYDNPTGQLCSREQLAELAALCVKHNLWLASDEAYRELFYKDGRAVSVWGLSDREVPGIEGRRIGVESTSKVWNACGLRIGALVTDSEQFHRRAVAEYTANLCANAIGQYIFGALAHESREDLAAWYERQRAYYRGLLARITGELSRQLPGLIVSTPDASIYSVLDVRAIAKPGFDAQEFVMYCASRGAVELEGRRYTLLVAPMAGFYGGKGPNPGRTQMRIAYVEPPETMQKVPILFRELLARFEAQRG